MAQIKTHFGSPRWQYEGTSPEQYYAQYGRIWQDVGTLQKASSLNEFGQALTKLNGFYAVVQHQPGQLFAAVDHIRSIPLFYGQRKDMVFLSDEAEWVRQQVGDETMDSLAREEFQLTGYVTGQDTLFPNVKQLQAGECVMITEHSDTPTVETQRYYRFLHTEPQDYDKALLEEKLDRISVASIQRLIDYAGGRQIVVPLSGGYDSRLIVALLKRLGYENTLTFTYGVAGNKESQYSKRVADALGLRWHFVEYSNQLWREAWESEERWKYQKWGSGWSSVAHVQDWLAVKIMKENRVIDSDAVFVPGHSGDFVAGSHIPDAAFTGEVLDLEDVSHALFQRHYNLAPADFLTTQEFTWKTRIKKKTEAKGIKAPWQYADAYEKWDWQERQAKFICNSVRVYEFFGYDWWMPLWDKEFVEFWQNVPLALRKNRTWCIGYIKKSYNEQMSDKTEGLGNASESPVSHIKKKASKIPFARKVYSYIKPKKQNQHPLALYGRYGRKEHKNLMGKGFSIVGLNAHDFLRQANKMIK
ncbi:asparagine synthetase B family protein [Halomonas sp. SL1]|uniref:asparagine synthase family protein n=1 Tax=Halomonas sp. SL1 TaxID=2137478 RepID=UPI000D17668B|nr:asparagine synthetase B family protein [Halomonas sp. SL1]RAH38218.1 asparagine synthetase B family protein [Halomonas sp. SL1]